MKKISLILAITMLLSGCNAVENTEQATSEKTTTTTAETTVVTTAPPTTTTTTTTTIATTTEKQTSATSKESEITQATKDTPNTSESEVYLFDYYSFDEIAPSEKEQFEILENVFYGEWESDRIFNDIFFTYQDCYFSFTNSCYPTCLMEIDEGYVLPYIAGGVVCCFFVNKNDLSVMYNAEYDFIIGGITIDENTAEYHKSSHSYSKDISDGELSLLGQMKLNSIIGGNFEECLNGTLDEKPIFTDIDGTEWVYGLGTLGTPDQERYLVSYSDDKVELGIRHFKKSEYDAYMDGELDDEPEERYFVLVFEKIDGVWQFKNTYEPIEEVYFADCEETFEINTITHSNCNVVFFETEYDETYNSKDNPEMFDENGMFIKERNYKSVYKKANKGEKYGNLTLIKAETHLAHLGVIDNSDIKTGAPGWARAEFEGEVTLDGVLYYADEEHPVFRGYYFIPFSSSLKANNVPVLHYYTGGWWYSTDNGSVSTSGRTTHFELASYSNKDNEKMEKILNGKETAKVRVTLSDIIMNWAYENGSGYSPYIAKLESITKINE